MERNIAVEATVYWLVVSSIVEFVAASTPQTNTPSVAVVAGIVFGALDLVLAYLCWALKRWGFVGAIALSGIIAVGAFPFPSPYRTVDTPYGALIDSLVILSGLLTIFFSYRAYRELVRK